MADFLDVVLVAFGYQLAVLPGEKVQFIIAGLSARYRPLVVVAAAGSAFAGWTALELLVGEALTRLLPDLVLDALTAGLFLLFAVLLVRSAPSGTDPAATGGPTSDRGQPVNDGPTTDDAAFAGATIAPLPDWASASRSGGFLPIFLMMAAGEFGDKTQLITIGLAAQYGAHAGIWVGEMLAILPVSLANAYVFHHLAERFPRRSAHYVGAAMFLFFGLDTVLGVVFGQSVWELVVRAVSDSLDGLVT